MSTETPSQKPDGKPTINQDNHDQNIGQRERTTGSDEKPTGRKDNRPKETGGKETMEQDNRGGNYGQREGSTISEDNDVE